MLFITGVFEVLLAELDIAPSSRAGHPTTPVEVAAEAPGREPAVEAQDGEPAAMAQCREPSAEPRWFPFDGRDLFDQTAYREAPLHNFRHRFPLAELPSFLVTHSDLHYTAGGTGSHSYIYAHYSNMTNMMFEDLPALFGSSIPKDGLKGMLLESRPLNGCTPIEPPPPAPTSGDPNATAIKYIVLIRRYDCNFEIKILHAQQAGFSAAIVHNMYSETLLNMNYSNETIAEEIEIPSVFTSYYASGILRAFIIPEQGAYVILKPEFAFPLSYYLIPFTGVVAMIFVVMVVVLIVRCVQYKKRMRKNKLTKEQLKKIPIHKFTKGDKYDVCAICLDEYEEGDKLRVLPCSHAYHSKCVDPWLTGTKKTCPVCKQRVTRSSPEYSESESEDERGHGGDEEGAEGEADTERTPLLRPSNHGSPNPGSPSVNPGSPSVNPGTYSVNPGTYSATVTTVTTAQFLGSPARRNSPILEYEGYYSPQEDSDSDTDEEEVVDSNPSDEDTAQLLGTGALSV
ncbi:hypothetical protein DPEC_G00232710 [Dallia pectoralis]|uniref:Uncharacterized protein n=1 Tax=Dallia pectoralis TaxID=75939 RepID=A0ACC2FXK2_DALPE|nr:hypothetical protein DPEC_G00232710 [Dallia pectoralis]